MPPTASHHRHRCLAALLCLALLPAWAGAQEPAAAEPEPNAVAEPAAGVELTPPVERGLRQLGEQWSEWQAAFFKGQQSQADEEVDRLLEEVERLGMEHLPDLSLGASARAVEAARQGDLPRARWALAAAERLDPGRPETAFRAARVEEAAGRRLAAFGHWLGGHLRLLGLGGGGDSRDGVLRLWLLLALWAAGGLWLAFQMAAKGPALTADLAAALSARLPRPAVWLAALVLLLWPVVLPGGLLWLLLYWSVLLWGYGSASERVVVVLLWLVAGVTPWLVAGGERRAELYATPAYRALDQIEQQRLSGRLFVDLEELVRAYPDDPAVLHLLADLHRDLGQWEPARSLYERVLEIEPDEPWVLLELGNYFFLQRAFGEAIGYYQRVTDLLPEHVGAWFNLSQAYSESFNFNEMEAAIGRAQDLDPSLVSRYQSESEERGIVLFRGGYEHIPALMRRVGVGIDRAHEGPDPAASLLLVPVLALVAGALHLLRRRRGYRAVPAPLARSASAGGSWLRALLPGLVSLETGHGGRALLALAPAAALLTLPLAVRVGPPLPPAAGGATLTALAAGLGVLYLGARVWWERR